MGHYSRNTDGRDVHTFSLAAGILGVICALLLVLTVAVALSEAYVPQNASVEVSDERFQDNLETYYDDIEPVPYSSYVAAGNR